MIDSLIKLFTEEKYVLTETIDRLQIKMSLNSTNFKMPEVDVLANTFLGIPQNDILELIIKMENCDTICIRENNIDESYQTFFENDDLQDKELYYIEFSLNIEKIEQHNEVTIYSIDAFLDYMSTQDLKGILFTLNKVIPYINFIIIDSDFTDVFYSKRFTFSNGSYKIKNKGIIQERKVKISKRNELSNFINSDSYFFTPEDFYLCKRSGTEEWNKMFDKLCNFFSIIFLSNYARITDDTLEYKIIGYKVVQNTLCYTHDLPDSNKNIIYRVYNWVYSEGPIDDKIGLSRNIISLQCSNTQDVLSLNDSILGSIKSGYSIYLKENVERYIEVKNKTTDYLMDISTRISELNRDFLKSFKNNILVLFTYFLSLFIYNALSNGKFSDIFSSVDIIVISYGLIVVSYFYYLNSRKQIILELKHCQKQFSKTKSMYNDILDEHDLNRIFSDTTFNEDTKFIKEQLNSYSCNWKVVMIIFGLIVTILSIADNWGAFLRFALQLYKYVQIILWVLNSALGCAKW